ncbi:hypothetical protein KY321_01690, partial [Candidatus Woesearchaeota archaeon]|nr:hypothetical protein [Candidatus Woesearchaeota archaeon]
MMLLKDIEYFSDIKFEEHPSAPQGIRALVDLGDSELSIVGGDGFYGDGVGSFEVAFIDKETNRISPPSNFLNMESGEMRYLKRNVAGSDFYADEPLPYLGTNEIDIIIKHKKELGVKDDENKQLPLKNISEKLVELAFLDREERKKGLIDLQADLDMTDEKTKLVADILLGISSEGEKPKKIETK